MPIVYCLQHAEYHDRETGVTFQRLAQPRVVKTETDEVGRETKYIAHSQAEVSEDELEYFRSRPHFFYVPEQEDGGLDGADEPFTVEERENAGWWDVIGPDGEPENEKALREDDAQELADHLNESVA